MPAELRLLSPLHITFAIYENPHRGVRTHAQLVLKLPAFGSLVTVVGIILLMVTPQLLREAVATPLEAGQTTGVYVLITTWQERLEVVVRILTAANLLHRSMPNDVALADELAVLGVPY